MKNLLKISLTLFITTIIVLGFAVPLNPAGTWQQQFMPDLHGAVIRDITFTDSLTGYAVTNKDSFNVAYILKTTNAGDSWFNSLTDNVGFTKVQFLNNDTGFISRLFTPPGFSLIYKTINGGSNWFTINTAGLPLGIHVLNSDTIWMAGGDFNTGIHRTTNGGSSWTWQYNSPSIDRIYMYNGRIGFMCASGSNSTLYRTTNSGLNWSSVSGNGFLDIYFVDSLTGWKANGDMKKTTDGGLNWVTQIIPNGGIIVSNSVTRISVLNKDTVWGCGGGVFYGSGRFRGILFRTINGGSNWLFQIPDTSFGIPGFSHIKFINKFKGWSYTSYLNQTSDQIINGGIRTINGGDTIFLLGLQQVSSEVPKQYKLEQNYPNPFNPVTKIGFRIAGFGLVTLKIFDITGKEIITLVNEELRAGEYKTDWNASAYASGVYFYNLTVTTGREVYSETKKLVLIK